MRAFRIMVTKYGYAVVQAENEDDALHLVNDMEDSDFDWQAYRDWEKIGRAHV